MIQPATSAAIRIAARAVPIPTMPAVATTRARTDWKARRLRCSRGDPSVAGVSPLAESDLSSTFLTLPSVRAVPAVGLHCAGFWHRDHASHDRPTKACNSCTGSTAWGRRSNAREPDRVELIRGIALGQRDVVHAPSCRTYPNAANPDPFLEGPELCGDQRVAESDSSGLCKRSLSSHVLLSAS